MLRKKTVLYAQISNQSPSSTCIPHVGKFMKQFSISNQNPKQRHLFTSIKNIFFQRYFLTTSLCNDQKTQIDQINIKKQFSFYNNDSIQTNGNEWQIIFTLNFIKVKYFFSNLFKLINEKKKQIQKISVSNEKQLVQCEEKYEQKSTWLFQEFIQSQKFNQQTSLILQNLVQEIKDNKIKQLSPAIKKIVYIYQTIKLYNHIVKCSEFSQDTQKLNYYLNLYIKQKSYNFTQMKLKFVHEITKNPQILRRIYFQLVELNDTEVKNLNKIEKFNIFQLYVANIGEKQQFQIKEKCRYMIHFIQFGLQIVNQLSRADNMALAYTFNVCRFLTIQLISHFIIQSLFRIQNQILSQLGEEYYIKFKIFMLKDEKLNLSKSKVLESIKLSHQKIQNYQQRKDDKNSPNTQKLLRIYKENPMLKPFLSKLGKQLQEINLTEQCYYQNHYNPQATKQIFKYIQIIAVKQLLSQNVIKRTVQKIIKNPKYKQLAGADEAFLDYQKFVKRAEIVTKKQFQQFFNQVSIPVYEVAKLFCMIFALPFYSFATERRNYQRKSGLSQQVLISKTKLQKQKSQGKNQIKDIQTCNSESQHQENLEKSNQIQVNSSFQTNLTSKPSLPVKKAKIQKKNQLQLITITQVQQQNQHRNEQLSPQSVQQLLKQIDFLYIYQKHRFNSDYLIKNRQNLHQIFKQQMKKYLKFIEFIYEINFNQNMHYLKFIESYKANVQEYYIEQKIIHKDRFSTFNSSQLTYLFSSLNQNEPVVKQKIVLESKKFYKLISINYPKIQEIVHSNSTTADSSQSINSG